MIKAMKLLALTSAVLSAALVEASYISFEVVTNDLDSDYDSTINEFFTNATAKWNDVIYSSLDDLEFTSKTNVSSYCDIDKTYSSGDTISNLTILVSITSDATENITAKPCVFAESDGTYLPRIGAIILKADYFETYVVDSTFFTIRLLAHEIGHVLGLGTLWNAYNYVESTTKYNGKRGVWGYVQVSGDKDVTTVPITSDNISSSTPAEHWSETVFTGELMTGVLNGKKSPLSILSVDALRDIGYQVIAENSEDYEFSYVADHEAADGDARRQLGNGPSVYGDFTPIVLSDGIAVFSDGTIATKTVSALGNSSYASTDTDDDDTSTDYVNIEIVSNELSQYTYIIKEYFANASAKWNDVIYTSLDDLEFTEDVDVTDYCGVPKTYSSGDTVSNLTILVEISSSAEENITAKPCVFAESDGTYLPRIGVIILNTDFFRYYVEDSTFFTIRLLAHEIGHVLGLGTLWNAYNYLESDTTYDGKRGVWGYVQVSGDEDVTTVPITSEHWSETVFTGELMTGVLNGKKSPLSILSVDALRDIGYQVIAENSEDYEFSYVADHEAADGDARRQLGNGPSVYGDFTAIDLDDGIAVFSDGTIATKTVSALGNSSYASTDTDDDDTSTDYVNIEIVSNELSQYTYIIKEYFANASAKWNNVIYTSLDDLEFTEDVDISDSCGIPKTYSSGDTVSNLTILVEISSSATENITAKPCVFAESDDTYFPRIGVIILSTDFFRYYVEDDDFLTVRLLAHEIGHVLGLGTLWNAYDYIKSSTKYNGKRGVWGYEQAANVSDVTYVPIQVDNTTNEGEHWSETVFTGELMTGVLSGKKSPLSVLSVDALRDIGYQVIADNSEDYDFTYIKDNEEADGDARRQLGHGVSLYGDFAPISLSDKLLVFADGTITSKTVSSLGTSQYADDDDSYSSSYSDSSPGDYITYEIVTNDLTDDASIIKTYLKNATAKWNKVIHSSLTDLEFTTSTSMSDFCGVDKTYSSGDTVSNLTILVSITSDATENITAKPCVFSLEDSTYMPRIGVLQFKTSYIQEYLEDSTYFTLRLFAHEIGHILGLGTLWNAYDYVESTTKYDGKRGVWGYVQVSGDEDVTYVPITSDNTSGAGEHWSETVFTGELMTGVLNGKKSPLSVLSVDALRDIGYTVYASNAEDYEYSYVSDHEAADGDARRQLGNGPSLYGDFTPIDLDDGIAVFSDGTVSTETVSSLGTASYADDDDDDDDDSSTGDYVNIDIVSNELSEYAYIINEYFVNASAKWNSVLSTSLDTLEFTESVDISDSCGVPKSYASGDTVTNLTILVEISSSATENITAKQCIFAESDGTYFPRVGAIILNTDFFRYYVEDDDFLTVRLLAHEIGHVLGLGTLWDAYGYVETATEYDGKRGVWGYRSVSSDNDVTTVPIQVDNTTNEGEHWSESVFTGELMTGVLSGKKSPLSVLSVDALRDLGYEVVDDNAEDYDFTYIKDNEEADGDARRQLGHGVSLYGDFAPVSLSDKLLVFANGAVKSKKLSSLGSSTYSDKTSAPASSSSKASAWEIATTVLACVFFVGFAVLAGFLIYRNRNRPTDAASTRSGISMSSLAKTPQHQPDDRAVQMV